MRKKYSILAVLAAAQLANAHSWVPIDFDVAMQTEKFPKAVQVTRQITGLDGPLFLDFCRQLFRRNNPGVTPPSSELKIPKIIHQIWIGGDVPEAFEPYMRSWTEKHMGPEWEYKLWRDKDIAEFDLYNQAYFDAIENPAAKSDLWRWEIVYRYGGVYVDMDFECLKSLDELHYVYDFYTALQPLDTQFAQLGGALVAARPGHPILKHCIETIKDDWHEHGIPAKTGPIHFTKSFYKVAGRNGLIDVAFPAYYFYPLGCREFEIKRQEWLDNGAYAVHHWAKSWMPARYRLKQFKKLDNDEVVLSWND